MRYLFACLWNPRSRSLTPEAGRDFTHVMRVLAVVMIIEFPCVLASVACVFLWAGNGDHALLTASAWLVRVAEGSVLIVWAAAGRFWWRCRKRGRRECQRRY